LATSCDIRIGGREEGNLVKHLNKWEREALKKEGDKNNNSSNSSGQSVSVGTFGRS